jgi:hypothetical protein
LSDNELPEETSGMAASGQRRTDSAGHSLAFDDAASVVSPDAQAISLPQAVARIAEAWPGLQAHIRKAILTLVDVVIERR